MALDNLIALCRLEGGNNTEEALQLKEALQLTDDLPLRRLNYQCFKNGRSALHEAAARGNLPIVQALLEREVDTSLEDDEQWIPFDLACLHGHYDVAREDDLLRHTDWEYSFPVGRTFLQAACLANRPRLVTTLINRGALVDEFSSYGHTAMTLVCSKGIVGGEEGEMIRLLVKEHHANVNLVDTNSGLTAFHLLCMSEYVRTSDVRFLLDNGADVNSAATRNRRNSNRHLLKTPFWIACDVQNLSLARLLILHGANVHATQPIDHHPRTAFSRIKDPEERAALEAYAVFVQKEERWRRRKSFVFFLSSLTLKNSFNPQGSCLAQNRVFLDEAMYRTITFYL